MLLCCKRFVYNPKLSNTPSPIILLWMYTLLTYLKNNFIANLLNAHLLGTTLITSSSVVSLNSHKTSFIMTLFLSLFDRWRNFSKSLQELTARIGVRALSTMPNSFSERLISLSPKVSCRVLKVLRLQRSTINYLLTIPANIYWGLCPDQALKYMLKIHGWVIQFFLKINKELQI